MLGEVEEPRTTLADVGGMAAIKRWLRTAFLSSLRDPEMNRLFGRSLRGGLLMYGPPGCGKTFLARAIAGELGAGGLCRVKGEWRVIVDRRATTGERLALLAQALVRFPLEGVSLSAPAADLIERTRGMGRSPSGPATPPDRPR